MSLQVSVDCPCRKCPWKLRGKCSHYDKVCLELRCCSACVSAGKNLETCVLEGSS
jgi:hypothetical protein